MTRKSHQPGTPSSIDSRSVVALLDSEELQTLLQQLETDEVTLIEDRDPQWILQWLTRQRGPFVKMAAEFCALLSTIEASVAGNVHFVVLPDVAGQLALDFGPQLRGAVAKALSHAAFAGEAATLEERLRRLADIVTRLCAALQGRMVTRHTSFGKQLQQMAENCRSPSERFMYEQSARAQTRSSIEHHPLDVLSFTEVVDALHQAEDLWKRIAPAVPGTHTYTAILQRVVIKAASKLRQIQMKQAVAFPFPAPSGYGAVFAECLREIRATKAAMMAASDFSDAAGDMIEFYRLELWRQRWRLYELWVLAVFVKRLTGHGACIRCTERVLNGRWTLKLTKDQAPVLGFRVHDLDLDLYYQYYVSGAGGGNMPDLLLKTTDGRNVIVIDPKHGESFSCSDLRKVADRYIRAFNTYSSCVVNYFPREPMIDRVSDVPSCVVLYGLQPDARAELAFSLEIGAALRALNCDSARETVGTALAILIDVSPSTEHIRQRLVSRAVEMLAKVPFLEVAASVVLMFAGKVVRQASVDDLARGAVDTVTNGEGTVFTPSVIAGVEHLTRWSGEREVWLFTDGVGELNQDETRTRLRLSGVRFRVWVDGANRGSDFCSFTNSVDGECNVI